MQALLTHHGALPRGTDPRIRRSCARPPPAKPTSDGVQLLHEARGLEGPCRVRIVFARRTGRRKLANLDELLERCNTWGLHADGSMLGSRQRSGATSVDVRRRRIVANCSAISLGELGLLRAAPLLAQADVMISVHGADILNALAMRAGSSVVEILPVHKANCPCDMYKDLLVPEHRLKYYALEPKANKTRAVSKGHVGRTYNSDLAVEWSALEGVLRRFVSARLRV